MDPKTKVKNPQAKQQLAKKGVGQKKVLVVVTFSKIKKIQFKTKDACPYCQMLISLSSLDTHIENCTKKPRPVSSRKVKAYDSAAARIQGTDSEEYYSGFFSSKQDGKPVKGETGRASASMKGSNSINLKLNVKKLSSDSPKTKSATNSVKSVEETNSSPDPDGESANWRRIHASTVQAIRDARRRAAKGNGTPNSALTKTKIYEGPQKSQFDPSFFVMDLYVPNEIWSENVPEWKRMNWQRKNSGIKSMGTLSAN